MNAAVDISPLTPGLQGVPETMLLTIWARSTFADDADGLLCDPMLNSLIERIDYDFRGRFGTPNAMCAIRSRHGDDLLRAFLKRHPQGSVVVLGEGLETQFWRVDNGHVLWYSVDLPESIDIRRKLLPSHERNHLIAGSALDSAWLERVAEQSPGPVFICAAGLLMYFTEHQVIALLRRITQTFSSGELFFDTIPPWFSRKTQKGWKISNNYTTPPMPFGMPLGRLREFTEQVPGLQLLNTNSYTDPYPQYLRFLALISRIGYVRKRFAPGLVHCRF
jgi:O-methyltransferase involved in polyketide biosynthesis